jgi:hypothetical protein
MKFQASLSNSISVYVSQVTNSPPPTQVPCRLTHTHCSIFAAYFGDGLLRLSTKMHMESSAKH